MNGQRATDRTAVVAGIATELSACTSPLIVVDAIDLAGAAEAVHLARILGAVVDHSAQDNVALLQEQSWLGTTPGEAVLRSDAVLLVGPLPDQIATDEALRRLCDSGKQRAFRYIGADAPPNAIANLVGRGLAGTEVGDISLTALIGALRAHVNGQAVQTEPAIQTAISALGDWLKGAKYGVAVFATGALSDLEGYALLDMLDDLSLETRWNALPLSVPSGQNELQRMSSSLTGLPAPLAFHGSKPSHDAWKFCARNMIARGECDGVLWLSSSETDVPSWLRPAPQIFAVTAHDTALPDVAAQLETGIAGVDHDAIVEPAEIGAFLALVPPNPSNRDSVAKVLRAIRHHLEHNGAAPA